MSIQAECREAMHRLASSGGTFTEYDVANEASGQGTRGWNGPMLEQAVKQAYTVLQGDYKRGKLVRYGPVNFDGSKDYARRGTKIVYAHPSDGPATLDTPNGSFPRLAFEDDDLSRAGRRRATNRDDTKPWAGQKVTQRTMAVNGSIDPAPLLKRIEQLEAENAKLRANGDDALKAHNDAHAAQHEQQLDALVDALVERLAPRVTDGVKEKMAEALIS